MWLLSSQPSCLQNLTGCTAQISSITAQLCCCHSSKTSSCSLHTHKNALPIQWQHILHDNLVVQGRGIAALCHTLQSQSQYDIQQVSNDKQQSYAEFLLALTLRFACCRQLFLQTPFRHEIHSDVQERIQEAFETGCEFREIAACFTQQGDIVTFQLLFLPVRPHHPIWMNKSSC